MEKVSMWAVAKKANLLIGARRGSILKYLAVSFVLGLVQLFDLSPDDPAEIEFSFTWLVAVIVYLTASTALGLSFLHFVVGSCRNRTSFYPAKWGAVTLKYIFASIAVSAISAVCAVISSLPLFVIVLSGVLDNPDTATFGLILVVPAVILFFLGGLIPMVRFSLIWPAIAIGDEYNYIRSWRMTKGHTIRLFSFSALMVVLLLLPSFCLGFFLDGTNLIVQMVGIVVAVFWWIWAYTFFGVLYEDLNNRYTAMTNSSNTVRAEKDEISFSPEADVRAK